MRLSWARLLKRVFEIDHCPNCGGELKIIAAILEQPVIEKILTHLGLQARAPPRVPPRGQAHAGCLTLPKRDCLGGPSSSEDGFSFGQYSRIIRINSSLGAGSQFGG